MSEKIYKGFIIDKSIKDKSLLRSLKIVNKRKALLGLITILEVEIKASDIDNVIKKLQQNMVTQIGLIKQEFYIHFYCGDKLIVLFREKIFNINKDKSTWHDAVEYGKSIGIIEKQLDFPDHL